MKPVKKQKGISVLYVVFVVSVLLAISFGLSAILIPQVKMLGEIGHSVVAFYAADSGVEKVLMDRQSPETTSGYYDDSLSADISYSITVVAGGSGDCSSDYYYCIKSVGTYKNTKRAIEISY